MTWLNKQVQKRPDHPAFIFRMNLGRFRRTRSQPLGSHISTGACTRRKRVALFSKNSKELYFQF